MKFLVLAALAAVTVFASSAHAQASCSAGVNHCANISWTAGAVTGNNSATGFNVYRTTVSGGCSSVGTLGCSKVGSATAPASTFTDSPLAATTTYFWVITATNSAGESGPSNQVTATTGQDPVAVPAAPINPSVVAK